MKLLSDYNQESEAYPAASSGVGLHIMWQHGPMHVAVNGATPDLVLRAVIDRLNDLQRCLPHPDNVVAINCCNSAIAAIDRRIADRYRRGVLGTDKP